MDVDEDDDGGHSRDANLVPLEIHSLPDGLWVTVIDRGQELQAQWDVMTFLLNLFSTQDEESIRSHFNSKMSEIEDIHRNIWPDCEVPSLLRSKHGAQPQQGGLYLKKLAMPTSFAICWLVWAISKNKRMRPERDKSKKFARRLLKHVLAVAGTLHFQIKPVGRNSQATAVQVSDRNSCVDSRCFWNAVLKGRIVPFWEAKRNDVADDDVTSTWDRPDWIDYILFSLDPKKGARTLLQPVIWTILAQTALWVDNNVSRLALSTDDRRQTRQKNQQEHLLVRNAVAIDAAVFLLFENDPLKCI